MSESQDTKRVPETLGSLYDPIPKESNSGPTYHFVLQTETKQKSNTPAIRHNTNVFKDTAEFTRLMRERTNKPHIPTAIDRKFIRKMVNDELDELDAAKDETEEVDALVDAAYYIFQHLSTTGLDIQPIWNLVHNANMQKFGPTGYLRSDGKWMKPKDFVPPDDAIRAEIARQRAIVPSVPRTCADMEKYCTVNSILSVGYDRVDNIKLYVGHLQNELNLSGKLKITMDGINKFFTSPVLDGTSSTEEFQMAIDIINEKVKASFDTSYELQRLFNFDKFLKTWNKTPRDFTRQSFGEWIDYMVSTLSAKDKCLIVNNWFDKEVLEVDSTNEHIKQVLNAVKAYMSVFYDADGNFVEKWQSFCPPFKLV